MRRRPNAGWSPLMRAADRDDAAEVDALLRAGAPQDGGGDALGGRSSDPVGAVVEDTVRQLFDRAPADEMVLRAGDRER